MFKMILKFSPKTLTQNKSAFCNESGDTFTQLQKTIFVYLLYCPLMYTDGICEAVRNLSWLMLCKTFGRIRDARHPGTTTTDGFRHYRQERVLVIA